ncbi:interleukin-2 [Macrotis lagotis]|uniref:interleukin-2 n=1 Tax=Macrotis lagotis TaxID=92651 RepID=UPI003D69CB1D
MNKIPLLCCISLTLVLVAHGAPTSPSPTTLLLFLQDDLNQIQLKLNNVSERMKKYEIYIPSNTSSIADLQCFIKELNPVAEALKYESRESQDIQTFISNINVNVKNLMGSETVHCHYASKIKIEGFFEQLIELCQKLRQSTL